MNTHVVGATQKSVRLDNGITIPCYTLVWSAGVTTSDLIKNLEDIIVLYIEKDVRITASEASKRYLNEKHEQEREERERRREQRRL